jgi:hypothetical protein
MGMGFARKLVMMGCTNQIPSLTFYEYRGYVIAGWARPELMRGSTSIGVVYKRDKFGSLIQVHRIEGTLYESKEQAEQHGIEQCKEWIDHRLDPTQTQS